MLQHDWGTLLRDLVAPSAAYPLYHVLLKGWVLLAGDSEWALRVPSALAGAAAVVVLYMAARELSWDDPPPALFPLAAAALLALSPFAIWYSQEAKVYSLLLLTVTLLLWSFLRALRLHSWQSWLVCGLVALLSIFVHRLAALLLVAAGVAVLLTLPPRRRSLRLGLWLLLVAAGGGLVASMVAGLGSEVSRTGAYIPAGPPLALWLTFLRFSLDRGPGEFPWWWLLPWVALTLWGLALLLRTAWAGRWQGSPVQTVQSRQQARVLLALLLVPLLLFLAQLAFTSLYEPRYLMIVFPLWLLVLAYPLGRLRRRSTLALASGLVLAALLSSAAVLTQPRLGLFSGYPVKEQYREAIAVLARQAHPDDAIILHPAYLRPLYDYYMQRLTADPPPEPRAFAAFKHFQTQFTQRDWDDARKEHLAGYFRSFLLIAPHHARTVDAPPQANDEYGLVGLYYRFSSEQQKWPCGIWRFNGAHVFCQDSPEAYETGGELRPQTRQRALFADTFALQGYTLKPTNPQRPGVYRAGGSLPITLFWDVTQQPARDYHMFLHLCQDCTQPPAASSDGPPLGGYLPTSVWEPRNPVHDERTIALPPDMPPGEYTLLLGMYDPADPAEAARLPVEGSPLLPANRLVLATVHIVVPEP
jgi:hypothetical protein